MSVQRKKSYSDMVGTCEMPGHSNAQLYADSAAQICKQSVNDLLSDCRLGVHKQTKPSILDVGCGTGETTICLMDRISHADEMVGFDLSDDFIEYARTENCHELVCYQQMDAEDSWPEEWKNRFSLVFSNYVLHWIKDHKKLMTNISKVLEMNGELLIQFFHSAMPSEDEMIAAKRAAQEVGVTKELQTGMMAMKKQSPQVWKDVKSYSDMISSLGFTVLRCEITPKHYKCASKFERAGMCVTVSPFMHHVPIEKRLAFATKYVNNLRDPLTIHHNAVICHAVKYREI